jgi:RNA polymerase sigma-70 factor (ECF subfamily)
MGNQDFVREVYDASYRRLVAQMFALCGDQHEAEEVVQEAFVKALNQGRTFAGLHNPEAWLRTVAVNQLRSRWRRFALWRHLLPRLPGTAHVAELSPDHVALVHALAGLPLPLREVVVLHHVADLPTAEIAATLGVAEGTVKSRLVKARSLLAASLADDEEPKHV